MIIALGLLLLVAGETEFDLVGFLVVMGASMLAGFRWTITQVLLQGDRHHGARAPAATRHHHCPEATPYRPLAPTMAPKKARAVCVARHRRSLRSVAVRHTMARLLCPGQGSSTPPTLCSWRVQAALAVPCTCCTISPQVRTSRKAESATRPALCVPSPCNVADTVYGTVRARVLSRGIDSVLNSASCAGVQ